MEQRLTIATQLLAGLISLDRVRPIRSRVAVVHHALQMTDLLLAMHHNRRMRLGFDPHSELMRLQGITAPDPCPAPTPCACQTQPRPRGRPRKSPLH